MRLSAAYVAAALRTGRAEAAQADSLAELAQERAAVDQQASELHAALVAHDEAPSGLVVHALGPMRVERDGQPITRWGGDKAGSRQAQALFAFLFDRAERGVAKDEVLELVWPDTDLERADLAFHRTMVGLRRTVDPARRGTDQRGHPLRQRPLSPRSGGHRLVRCRGFRRSAWWRRARPGSSHRRGCGLLEQARALVRGAYLDDCPFFGDSAEVEDRREELRRSHADLLVTLGEAYEATGDRMAALEAYREAVRVAPDASGPAGTGLERLGARV